jgi:hypothetical protein
LRFLFLSVINSSIIIEKKKIFAECCDMASRVSVNWQTAYVCLMLRLGETLNIAFSTTPLLRLLESNVCRNYYRHHDSSAIALDGNVPEDQCKVVEIQGRISDLNGTASILTLLPGM